MKLPLLPNGILLAAHAGEFPFSALRPGMPVLLGGLRLYFEPFACSLDLSSCPQWDPHIYAPSELNRALLHINAKRLAAFCQQKKLGETFNLDRRETILELAEYICGRGAGLTPSGDDFLVGWMAVGWLLYGPQKDFLLSCQRILELA
ncbi:MAG TPA: DUF2877 domain-containing protein, partial [Ktedonobacteraceae bacterium]|nr:DUF2877 domain-containing protein [Ktedonobacteraceae bacterium]